MVMFLLCSVVNITKIDVSKDNYKTQGYLLYMYLGVLTAVHLPYDLHITCQFSMKFVCNNINMRSGLQIKLHKELMTD